MAYLIADLRGTVGRLEVQWGDPRYATVLRSICQSRLLKGLTTDPRADPAVKTLQTSPDGENERRYEEYHDRGEPWWTMISTDIVPSVHFELSTISIFIPEIHEKNNGI